MKRRRANLYKDVTFEHGTQFSSRHVTTRAVYRRIKTRVKPLGCPRDQTRFTGLVIFKLFLDSSSHLKKTREARSFTLQIIRAI